MSQSSLPDGITVLERGWLSSNNIVFSAGPRTAMIDSGHCSHAAQTVELVGQVLGHRTLDVLVNTHLHSDHCGANSALQQSYPSLTTLIPPGQAQSVSNWDDAALGYEATGQSCPRFRFTSTLSTGSTLELGTTNWEIHGAPGHDPHAVVLFQPEEKILISGDALWENGFGVVFPELDSADGFEEVAETLNLIEQLQPVTVIPGHGPVFSYTPRVIQDARSRLAAFASDPKKHAAYAAKVLVKFRLLDIQRHTIDELIAWINAVPYCRLIHAKYFPELDAPAWAANICAQLVNAKAAKTDGYHIFNM